MALCASKRGPLQFNFFEANEDKYKNLVGFKYHDEFIDLKLEHLAKEQVRKGGLPPLLPTPTIMLFVTSGGEPPFLTCSPRRSHSFLTLPTISSLPQAVQSQNRKSCQPKLFDWTIKQITPKGRAPMQIRIALIYLLTLVAASSSYAASSSQLQSLSLPADSPRWDLQGEVKTAEYQGRKCIYLNGGSAVVKERPMCSARGM